MMNEKCAVFRDREGLTQAHETIRRLKEEAEAAYIDDRGTVFNQDVLGAIELGYMLDCAEAIVMGALERKESRGAQFRLDFPERNDDEWLKHITISVNGGDAPKVDYAPVTMTQWEPQERDVLDGRVHAQAAPVPARSGEAPYWEEFTDRPRRQALRARRHPPGQGPPGRLDRHPLLVPRRDLRLLRRAHQRPARRWPATCTSTRPPSARPTARSWSSRWATCPCSRT